MWSLENAPRSLRMALTRIVWGAVLSTVFGCGATSLAPYQAPADDPNTTASQAGGSSSNRTSGTSGDGGFLGGGGATGGDGGIISRFKPALAVRATGCIMCHAQVRSTVITDFGYGDSYYFGAGAAGLTPFSGSVYGNHALDWASARVWGSIVVPKASLPSGLGVTPTTLAGYLRSVVTAPDSASPAPAVTEETSVSIGSPTTAQILTLAGTFPAAHPLWKYFPRVEGSGDITGIAAAGGGAYVQTSGGPVNCDGELFVSSVLFLNQLQLNTALGCHIYATGSVFVQGPITYSGGTLANLQISSSRAILLGLGHGPVTINANDPTVTQNSVSYRLHDFWTRGGYFTRAVGAVQDKNDQIVADSDLIPDLTDAALQSTGRAVGFSHLLLNAPQVHSRYQGPFQGVVIAEVAIAALADFDFAYDSVFDNVPVLPALPETTYLAITQ